jgi:hypothetical protein
MHLTHDATGAASIQNLDPSSILELADSDTATHSRENQPGDHHENQND